MQYKKTVEEHGLNLKTSASLSTLTYPLDTGFAAISRQKGICPHKISGKRKDSSSPVDEVEIGKEVKEACLHFALIILPKFENGLC